MNFIYVIHLLYWNQLTDLIIHSRSNRSNINNSIHGNNKGGRARSARPLLLFLLPLLFLMLLLSLQCVIRSVRWFQYNKWMT